MINGAQVQKLYFAAKKRGDRATMRTALAALESGKDSCAWFRCERLILKASRPVVDLAAAAE